MAKKGENMASVNGLQGVFNSSMTGLASMQATTMQKSNNEFEALLESMKSKQNTQTVASAEVVQSGKLNGDYTSSFEGTFTSESDKTAKPTGAAANFNGIVQSNKTIDKTSKLYEKSLELESYFVKIMLSSMKNTLSGTGLNGEKSYAQSMYEDMLYDELAVSMTKNASFGIADQIYLELA